MITFIAFLPAIFSYVLFGLAVLAVCMILSPGSKVTWLDVLTVMALWWSIPLIMLFHWAVYRRQWWRHRQKRKLSEFDQSRKPARKERKRPQYRI